MLNIRRDINIDDDNCMRKYCLNTIDFMKQNRWQISGAITGVTGVYVLSESIMQDSGPELIKELVGAGYNTEVGAMSIGAIVGIASGLVMTLAAIVMYNKHNRSQSGAKSNVF